MKLTAIHPKLPMRDKAVTSDFYLNQLGFSSCNSEDYPDYLMIRKDQVEIHFFVYRELPPEDNYGMIYIRTDDIQQLYQSFLKKNIAIHPNGGLTRKPWGQWEFSILDPDNNLLTFGQAE
ncbi:bleomycin resistance protein [Sphingobacterium thalpophilum]|uniref:bleomycin resistance protein n=1 Tax=Sphingobacterium thalpophilum TaxID=259 RepID=UPI003C78C418